MHTYSTSVVLLIQFIVYVCTVENSITYNVNVILLSTVYYMYISSRSGSLVCKRLGFEDYKFQFSIPNSNLVLLILNNVGWISEHAPCACMW